MPHSIAKNIWENILTRLPEIVQIFNFTFSAFFFFVWHQVISVRFHNWHFYDEYYIKKFINSKRFIFLSSFSLSRELCTLTKRTQQVQPSNFIAFFIIKTIYIFIACSQRCLSVITFWNYRINAYIKWDMILRREKKIEKL